MKKTIFKSWWLYLLAAWVSIAVPLFAQETAFPGTEVVERLGERVPLEVRYVNDNGDSVQLGALLDKPTILLLVYYNCPGICVPLLNGMVTAIQGLDMQPGIDYKAISLSFNELETAELARQKKANYLKQFPNGFPDEAWHWLTGDNRSIKKLTRSVGFNYIAAGKDFYHSAVAIVLSADGTITRYFHGVYFSPFDLKMALMEAQSPAQRGWEAHLLNFTFRFDEGERRYMLNSARMALSGGGILLLGIVAGIARRRMRQNN
ncbi:MAG: SCO family protein [Calditrichaeota bacterium]|nr:SCO family protein [Calditrichota bacterium]